MEEFGKESQKIYKFRLINIDSEGNPKVIGMPDSNWIIVNWQVY